MRLERPVNHPEKICWQVNAGLLPYAPACALQHQLVEARKAGAIPDLLLFCEHPHTITMGRNGKKEHLRASNHLLSQMNVTFHETNRGGDITYHGPGQIVAYPILDLTAHRRDVRWYVQQLEETMIRATADFKVAATRIADRHGIWVGQPPTEEKLAALGVHLSRWVTSHGFAYNVATDLRYFDLIVPCGIAGKRATSLERVLDRAVRTDEVRPRLAAHFGELFERDMLRVSRAELEEKLQHHIEHALAPRPSEILELKGSLA
jgi:lipoyl(octanoyl) transferase